jgi:hypothetical protein
LHNLAKIVPDAALGRVLAADRPHLAANRPQSAAFRPHFCSTPKQKSALALWKMRIDAAVWDILGITDDWVTR